MNVYASFCLRTYWQECLGPGTRTRFSVDWTTFCGFYRVQDKSTCYCFTAWCQVSRGEAPERMASIVGMLFPRMHSLKIYPVDTEDGPCHAKVHFSGRVPDKKGPPTLPGRFQDTCFMIHKRRVEIFNSTPSTFKVTIPSFFGRLILKAIRPLE